MLAPITVVCDRASGGSDDGSAQSGECSVGGLPGGDVYRPGQFRLDMTAMDVNNDGCVELPFVADPTTLTLCSQSSNKPSLDDSASAPQATFQQAVRHVITHELGHAVGVNMHTSVATDLIYMYSINWTRAMWRPTEFLAPGRGPDPDPQHRAADGAAVSGLGSAAMRLLTLGGLFVITMLAAVPPALALCANPNDPLQAKLKFKDAPANVTFAAATPIRIVLQI
jgi:hypothetical protein